MNSSRVRRLLLQASRLRGFIQTKDPEKGKQLGDAAEGKKRLMKNRAARRKLAAKKRHKKVKGHKR